MARLRLTAVLVGGVALATAAACSSTSSTVSSTPAASGSPVATGSPASTTGSPASTTAASSAIDLAGVCPSTIKVQTDWYPEADDFIPYQLAGPNGTVNSSNKSYTAELLASGQDTGVKIQVLTGGPAIGDQLVSAELYEDPSILLGFVETDEAIELSSTQPTVAVIADRQEAPTVIAWSAAEHPGVKTIADLGKDGATVLYYNGAPYMDYLIGAGILSSKQTDASYNGTPADFVASGGKDALQGFATAEPYEYAHEVSQWDKPLTYQLVSDYGYDPYPSLATLPQNITKYAACFKKLVPIIQQGIVNYAANPGPADALILKVNQEYNDAWVYSAGEAAYAAQTMVSDKIIANAPDGTVGAVDDSRIQKLIGLVTPIYKKDGKTVKAGLTPADIATNQFLDPSIHLPS
jgi:hypothetical protein